ncbi:alternative ribosome rescue aminoacyl-tRNA hydrolase ArfB [Afifella marina]|uniref:Ribosome-associated protein n=1 Tax=Afifella marina DSM 2698 TaxID=1120955 RepID=A0A1G5NZT5_AFIMA|nr:alternative ribosome rescue aminoacyl-tRNA hydrolase ArfB [Afifella marina]MBK1624940.1 aminoacyl-tRNA hydrolase [Afifella marina DSM 2698]MBK1628643.1 aminoacyl-tRNA hydrolase [Afifella marina]MBK5916473.1 aminoacyl-tRNA hydrolase [Afifella marina]RAI17704.1 aminoacyl-tRNA hydrolase [Afifella marina DSM 2698]SCZ42291.1 ribosome-associated protein [Afifella marina DSM 2698]
MIRISTNIALAEDEIEERFVQASGPGGQNVNKVASAVELRFALAASQSLPPDVKQRVTGLAGRRLNKDGVLVIRAERFRSQEQNREDAEKRLVMLIRQALTAPKKRRPTRPTRASKERRLKAKKARGSLKKERRGEW